MYFDNLMYLGAGLGSPIQSKDRDTLLLPYYTYQIRQVFNLNLARNFLKTA